MAFTVPATATENPEQPQTEESETLETAAVTEDVLPPGLISGSTSETLGFEGAVAGGSGQVALAQTNCVVPGDAALAIVNAERAKFGLDPIMNSGEMFATSAAWSAYMAGVNKMIHMYEVFNIQYQMSFGKTAGYSLGGDLIAWNYQSEVDVAKAWLNSPGHNAWLMDKHGSIEVAGVARVGDYWTMYLAGRPLKDVPASIPPPPGAPVPAPTTQTPEFGVIPPVPPTPPLVIPSMSLTGTGMVGQTLSGSASWTGCAPRGVTETYTWKVGDEVLGTGKTLKIPASAAGKTVTLTYSVKDHSTGATVSKFQDKHVILAQVSRLSGPSRYETNLAVNSVTGVPGGPVFVATGSQFADALSIGPVVRILHGSLFITPSNSIDAKTLSAIRALTPSAIYIVGGTGAVSPSVENQLLGASGKTPVRVAGADRYGTSKAVFEMFFVNQSRAVDTAFVATGLDYPDALSAAAAGGALKAPVLLVNGRSGTDLPPSITATLKAKGTSKVLVTGGEAAVNNTILSNLSKSFKVERLAGPNRYSTNLAVNNYLTAYSPATAPTSIWLATGMDFPDALSSGAAAGNLASRLVLSTKSCIPKPVVSEWIAPPTSKVAQVRLVGGEGVLAPSVTQLTQCG